MYLPPLPISVDQLKDVATKNTWLL